MTFDFRAKRENIMKCWQEIEENPAIFAAGESQVNKNQRDVFLTELRGIKTLPGIANSFINILKWMPLPITL